jgi:hypothetical protein
MRFPYLIDLKGFLQKPFLEELAEVWLICSCYVIAHMWPIRGFGT